MIRFNNDKKHDRPIPVSAFAQEKKRCDHKYIYLDKRMVGYIDKDTDTRMTKYMDVFYCEKCLDYKYKECKLSI